MTSVLKEETIKVPMLKADGSNWIIYKSRIELAAEAQGLHGYLTGTKVLPRHPQTGKDDTWTLNKDEQKLIDKYDKAEPEWTKENAKVKQIITASTPDTLYLKFHSLGSAHSLWEALTSEFEQRSGVVAIELCRKLQGVHCGEKADVRAHFSKMELMWQELASLGQLISDSDYTTILLGSLPSTYNSTISSLCISAKMNYQTITPQIVKSSIIDDYDTRHAKSRKPSNTTANDDVTYSVQSKKNLLCTNCSKKGHTKENCWAEGGDKAGQGPKGRGNRKGKGKATEKAAKAAEKDEEPDGAWLTRVNDKDWFVELADKVTPDLIYDTEDAYMKTFSHALLAGENLDSSEHMELFDSGTSHHMSSYRNQFIDYKVIVPKSITAADNHTFQAIGK